MNLINDTPAMEGKNMKGFGIVTIIIGIMAIAAPLITGLSVVFLVGLLVLAGGIVRMIWAIRADSLDKGIIGFVIGILTLLGGAILVTDPLVASGILTILLAAYFLVDGLFEVVAAFRVRPASGWGWLLVCGAVSILLALLIWQQFPLSGAWAIGVLLGIKLLLVGMVMIGVGTIPRSNA
jgi:uncharacterized membrane protein HdeD (DUF308 family)